MTVILNLLFPGPFEWMEGGVKVAALLCDIGSWLIRRRATKRFNFLERISVSFSIKMNVTYTYHVGPGVVPMLVKFLAPKFTRKFM
jgi:hypothetical protein